MPEFLDDVEKKDQVDDLLNWWNWYVNNNLFCTFPF